MSICDDCVQNMEDCHDGFLVMKLVRQIKAWKMTVTDDLTRVPDWAVGCPGFMPQDHRPFATAEEVHQHRDEEECLDELIAKAVSDGRLPRE